MPSVHWKQPWLTVSAVNRRSASPQESAEGYIETQRLRRYAAVLELAAEAGGYEQVPAFVAARQKVRAAFEARHLAGDWTEEELAAELEEAKESTRQHVDIPEFDREAYEKPDRLGQAAAALGAVGALVLVVGAAWLALTVIGWLFGGSSGDFLETVRQSSSSFLDIPDSTLVDSGETVCDADDAGMEDWAVRASFIDNGLTPSETSALVYAAREHLC
ncbi:DUF732 domain-containing protein [Geodermatophilus telluris]|uniref:DUF732 domain-containing protein n=1 Tax=Geodermatophilus telluris TaxID=1190417 RepID=UPI001113AD7F|nr:DUF732 domain-containing protein [Geodermatophilus telluris]